jgi:hypothetical protein
MRALPVSLAAAALLFTAALARGAAPAAGPVDAPGTARVPHQALPLQPLWTGSFSGADAYGANLMPGPDHEAEGPPALAALVEGGFAVLDPLGAQVHLYDDRGVFTRLLKLDPLGDEAGSALDVVAGDSGAIGVWLSRGAGAVALFDASGVLSARADLDPARSPATGLSLLNGQLFASWGDVRAWQPLRPLEAVRRGLPSPGGDCNAALLGDGRAIARCHTGSGLRELFIEPDPDGGPIAAVEQVYADASGGLCAQIAVRVGAQDLRRLAVRVDSRGAAAWADLGADAPWFTARAAAFTTDGRLLRLTGDASGPRVMTSPLRPVPGVTP